MSQPDGAAHVGARRTRVPQDPPSSGPTVHATEPLGWSSLLFTSAADASPAGCQGAPTYFGDLNLDQLVDAVSGGDDALASILHRALDDVDAIEFRHQVWRDLERPDVLVALRRFTDRMVVVRRLLGVASSMRSPGSGSAGSSTRPRSIARTSPACALPWTVPSRGHGPDLGAAVACLIRHLSRLHPPGHRPVGDHGGAGRVRYCLTVRGGSVRVPRYAGEADDAAELEWVTRSPRRCSCVPNVSRTDGARSG